MDRLIKCPGLVVAFCSFGVALGAISQSDTKITLTMPATNAALALKQLGAAAHVQLLTSPQTAKDVVCFQFKDVPLSGAMSRIADVVHGTWKREGSAYRLIRTSSQQNAETRIEFNETVALVRKSIQKRANELNRMRQWSESDSNAKAVSQ